MRPSIRVLFLLIVGCVFLNVGHLMAFITIFGYLAADGPRSHWLKLIRSVSGPRPPMKADISTLHKQDILTLQRHD